MACVRMLQWLSTLHSLLSISELQHRGLVRVETVVHASRISRRRLLPRSSFAPAPLPLPRPPRLFRPRKFSWLKFGSMGLRNLMPMLSENLTPLVSDGPSSLDASASSTSRSSSTTIPLCETCTSRSRALVLSKPACRPPRPNLTLDGTSETFFILSVIESTVSPLPFTSCFCC